MARIEGEIIIARPVDEVFDFVADERNEPTFNPRMLRAEQVSEGPIGLGARFDAESRSIGSTVTMTIEFIEFERPRRLTSVTRLPSMDIQGTLTFEPAPAGTRLRWAWELYPSGILRLLTPLLTQIGQRQEREIWTGLKRHLEGQPAPLPQVARVSDARPSTEPGGAT